MLFFRSEELIDAWCAARRIPRGETLTAQKVWELSQPWYGDRLNPDFRGRTVTAAMKIFADQGLTSPFWQVPPS